ncbi:MAG: DUF4272 domain-containing protein [Tepidisphaeraceae bacterium]|jgi:hypothetical protein
MGSGRDPRQIARRAVILATISFRSSLELTAHPRVVEISGRLLPWLSVTGCDDEVDPIERDLLATSYGKLSDSQKIDAKWAGEGAAFFCWALNLREELEEAVPANPSNLPTLLGILKPQAHEIIESATLRDQKEIEDTCRQFVLIRSLLQEARVDSPASDIIRRVHVRKLHEVGLSVAEDGVKRAADAIGRMTPKDRANMAGAYFVRHHSALWFLSDRRSWVSRAIESSTQARGGIATENA